MIRTAVRDLGLSLVTAIGFIMAVSCSSPEAVEQFVSVSDVDAAGRLGFELNMSDTSATYDLSFFTRVDSPDRKFGQLTEFPLRVYFVSPAGKVFSETVYLPLELFEGTDSFVHDICVDYRSDIVPYEYGIWNLYVIPPAVDGLRGIGVILNKTGNGKR